MFELYGRGGGHWRRFYPRSSFICFQVLLVEKDLSGDSEVSDLPPGGNLIQR